MAVLVVKLQGYMRLFYITLLIIGAAFLVPNFAQAALQPPQCIGTTQGFIFVDNNNSAPVNGGNGKDCILVGNNNSGVINGGNGKDIIVIGYDNSGAIDGGHSKDEIFIGEGNTVIPVIPADEPDQDTVTPISKIPAPSADPLPDVYHKSQDVTLTSAGSTSILYSTEEVPNCFSSTGTLYSSPISITSTATIKAVACSAEGFASDFVTYTYTINIPTSIPTLTPVPTSYTIGQSQITLDEDVVITRADGEAFDVSMISFAEVATSLLSGLAEGQVFEAALQWGIAGATLEFSQPITINIFVGVDLNGQTLNIFRSKDGTVWETIGLVNTTCVVANGICSFQATKASYYAATSGSTPPPASPPPVSISAGAAVPLWILEEQNKINQAKDAEFYASQAVSTPTPEITPEATPTVIASVPKKVSKPSVAMVQKTPEPAPLAVLEKRPDSIKRNLLSNILSSILGLFRWLF
ncbi:MAG: chitobiase/beta-hexosaminidase C-terminal domain-containing protein [Candidatus Paceibacterota bacterium]